ncbi:hypothetical protein [Streptomyces sp. NPDC047886]|uniref:hypothetical protein n=1 Tax=Streptomyces sp. NPDC047886 TaxID=3365490 RepID=UPI0037146A8E
MPARARLAYPPLSRRRTNDGPLAVLEAVPHGLTAHLVDGSARPCDAGDLPDLLNWTLRQRLGAKPLRSEALPAGPLLVLTSSALARLVLPSTVPTGAERHPRSDHPLLRQIRAVGWQTDQNGLGPWMRLHPSTGDPACDSIHLAVIDWGALHHDAWNLPTDLAPGRLARLLGKYTSLLRTPVGPPGATGHQLMRDLRPASHRHSVTGALIAAGTRGALTQIVDPAPCEAPPGHRLATDPTAKDPNADIHWWRPPTADEASRAHVVCLAVNLLPLAGSAEIRVSAGPAQYVTRPDFHSKTPGSWLVDLSTAQRHPLLPAPFAGSGPAWHTTPTLNYAVTRQVRPQPTQGWLRSATAAGPYLKPFYERIRAARLAVLEGLGVTGHTDTADVHQTLTNPPHSDPVQRALLYAIHATAEDALTELAQPPTQPDELAPIAWATPAEPTWRPDLLAAVRDNARANLHRKLSLTAAATGYFPLAVAGDHVLYATHTPHLGEVTDRPDCAFTLGIACGHARPVAVRPMTWFTEQCAKGLNAAQSVKEACPSW